MTTKPMNRKRLEKIVADISFPDWEFYVESKALVEGGEVLYLRVGDPNGVDTFSGKPYPWKGRKWEISGHATKNEVVLTAWKAVHTALEHEAREAFKYKGSDVLNPHYDMDKLRKLRERQDALDTRPNKDYDREGDLERLPAFITGEKA